MEAETQELFRCGDCCKSFTKRIDYKYTTNKHSAEQRPDQRDAVDIETATRNHIYAHSATRSLASKRALTAIDRLTAAGNLVGTSNANF